MIINDGKSYDYQLDSIYLRRAYDRFEKYNDYLRLENDNLHRENDELHRTIAEQESQYTSLYNQLNSIENSTIWRMSKPLRRILDCIKQIIK